jgi:hypothetical protein
LEGDANTRFFHLVANGKPRKQLIYRLEDDNGVAVNSDRLKCHITNYYKNLFGIPEQTEITLMDDQIHDIPQVSDEENEILIADFTENEVKEAVFKMEHNKSPGPDGFLAEFYQVFCGVIKDDLLAMLHDFHKDSLDLFSRNLNHYFNSQN